MKKTLALALALLMLFSTCSAAMATWSEDQVELSPEEAKDFSVKTSIEVAEEGMILLRNEGETLPLKDKKVNVFGATSLDPVYDGGGGGAVTGEKINFYQSLEHAGIEYNTELYQAYADWYAQFSGETPYAGGVIGDEGAAIWDLSNSGVMRAQWNILHDVKNEDGSVRVPKMNPEILKNAEEYSETAVVVIGRKGSEGSDIKESELEISEAEAAVLSYVTANYDNVIVVFNISNMMEMGWLEGGKTFTYSSYAYGEKIGSGRRVTVITHRIEYDEPQSYTIGAVDSALLIFAPGVNGMEAVGEILTGKVNPSGRLSDTIPYDISDSPVGENYGDYTYDDGTNQKYVTYEEGIYVGYKYFETFAPEQVQYSFGYGLSYTSFEWSDFSYAVGTNDVGENTLEASVKVTNTGDKAGKDVLELYYTQPYYNDSPYKVEKSLVTLGGYEKTKLLQPGESQTVKVVLNIRDMASWSSEIAAYVLEHGEYTIEIAKSSANARELYYAGGAGTYKLSVADGKLNGGDFAGQYIKADEYGGVIYTADEVTGGAYTRLFEDCEGIVEVNAQYMQRVDVDGVPTVKEGTYPKSPLADNYYHSVLAYHDEYEVWKDIYKAPDTTSTIDEANALSLETGAVYYNENGQADVYTFQEMWADIEENGVDKDEAWDKFLDQFTVYELIYINGHGRFELAAMEQYGVYKAWGCDGPAQVGSAAGAFGYGQKPRDPDFVSNTTGFPCLVLLASTWNRDVCYKMGEAMGYEAYYIGLSVLYAPGLNIHRGPFCGRNFEYFSEDAFLAGHQVASELLGMQAHGGLIGGVKHCMLNNQETNRKGVNTYLSEQALRESYGPAWETAFKDGNTKASMTAFNAIGYTYVGNCKALFTGLLRDEWGWDGYCVSDIGAYNQYSFLRAVLAGHDTPEQSINWNASQEVLDFYEQDPVTLLTALRNNVRHVYTCISLSNGYVADVDAAIAEMQAGGYQFDYTPDESGYTDVGWYGTVTVGEDHVIPTEPTTVEIPVSISGNQGVTASIITITSGLRLTIDDPNVLAVNEQQTEDGWSYKLSYCEIDDPMANGEIFTLKFDVDENTPNGKYALGITYEDATDRWAHATKLNVKGGTLIIGDNPKGDVNGDYELTNADLIMVARYLVGLEEFDERQMELADFNDDCSINNTDLVMIARAIVRQ